MKIIKHENKEYHIKPCPLCGHTPQDEYDFIHPTIGRWDTLKEFEPKENFEYFSKKENPYENNWQISCLTHECGCGFTVFGNSFENVVKKWNKETGEENA